MSTDSLQLEAPEQIARKQNQCEDQATVRQSLVQPFILHTLGYDVFDPLTTMPDTTGATYDANLLHPDARVDYAIRRNGLPALLIAVHGPSPKYGDRIDQIAQTRLAQCLSQSTAELGAITDGRRWTWYAKLPNTGTVAFHRTDLVQPTAEDIGIIEAITRTGWNKKTLLDYAQGVMYEARIQASLLQELREPGIEFARWMSSLIHQGPKSPKLLELIHQRLPSAIEKVLRTLQETEAESGQSTGPAGGGWDDTPARPATQPMLTIECAEENWIEPEAGISQAGLLRHVLDYLAQHPDAERIFETVPRLSRDFMSLSEVTRSNPQRYWTKDGWYTTTVRRLHQKITLINEIARKLGLSLKAVPSDQQRTAQAAETAASQGIPVETPTSGEGPTPVDDETREAGTAPMGETNTEQPEIEPETPLEEQRPGAPPPINDTPAPTADDHAGSPANKTTPPASDQPQTKQDAPATGREPQAETTEAVQPTDVRPAEPTSRAESKPVQTPTEKHDTSAAATAEPAADKQASAEVAAPTPGVTEPPNPTAPTPETTTGSEK